MPIYDFRCDAHGIFDAISAYSEDLQAVRPVPCPKCGAATVHVWRRAPAVRNNDIRAVKLGNHVFDAEQLERQIDVETSFNPDDDSDAFWNKSGFEEKYLDTLEKNNSLAEHGELPPLAPPDVHSQKVLTDALSKKG